MSSSGVNFNQQNVAHKKIIFLGRGTRVVGRYLPSGTCIIETQGTSRYLPELRHLCSILITPAPTVPTYQ